MSSPLRSSRRPGVALSAGRATRRVERLRANGAMNPRDLPGPFVFDAARGAWVPAPPSVEAIAGAEPVPPRVSLATWNVWFGEYEPDLRRAALLEILGARAPDVICLQEVTDDFLAALRAAAWVRARYALSDATGDSYDDYGVVLLARRPLARLALAPQRARQVV